MDYLKISSLNEQEAMVKPKFLINFEFIEKIDLYDSNLDNEVENNISKIKKNKKKLNDFNLINSKLITIPLHQKPPYVKIDILQVSMKQFSFSETPIRQTPTVHE